MGNRPLIVRVYTYNPTIGQHEWRSSLCKAGVGSCSYRGPDHSWQNTDTKSLILGDSDVNANISTLAAAGLAAGLLLLQAGCADPGQEPVADIDENPALAAPVPAGMTRGKVLETVDSGGYTYVLVETSEAPIWAAGPQTVVKVGDIVEISQGMPMQQFQSETLNRTFDVLYFVGSIANLTAPNVAAPAPTQASDSQPAVTDVSVAELEPGKNIAWVYANKEALANEAISLRGKVVKYNSNIMGWNFIHIQDGSGDAAARNGDLTVTSKATTAVGETVVIAGTVILDKDFGAGYLFPVLVEDASITAE